MDEVGGGRPASNGSDGHRLLFSHRISQLVEQLGKAVGCGTRRWYPIRGTGVKGEPIGCGSANHDAVDSVLKFANERIDVGRRGIEFVEVVSRRRSIGLGTDSKEAR